MYANVKSVQKVGLYSTDNGGYGLRAYLDSIRKDRRRGRLLIADCKVDRCQMDIEGSRVLHEGMQMMIIDGVKCSRISLAAVTMGQSTMKISKLMVESADNGLSIDRIQMTENSAEDHKPLLQPLQCETATWQSSWLHSYPYKFLLLHVVSVMIHVWTDACTRPAITLIATRTET